MMAYKTNPTLNQSARVPSTRLATVMAPTSELARAMVMVMEKVTEVPGRNIYQTVSLPCLYKP
jgi:hypothetical protein